MSLQTKEMPSHPTLVLLKPLELLVTQIRFNKLLLSETIFKR